MFRRILIFLLTMFGLPLQIWAGAGLSGAQVLLEETSVRSAAMAGVYVAWQGQADCLTVNPAGMHSLNENSIRLVHSAGFAGLATESISVALPVPELGIVAFHANYRSQPTIDNEGASDPPVDVRDMVFGGAFAASVSNAIVIGGQVKIINIALGQVETMALAIDLGLQYKLGKELMVAAAMRNIGPNIAFNVEEDPLPTTFLIGVKDQVYANDDQNLVLGADLDVLIPEQNITLRFGGEFTLQKVLAFRMGYAYSGQTSVNGFAAGVGFQFKVTRRVSMHIDYTFLPQFWENEEFAAQNLLGLTLRF